MDMFNTQIIWDWRIFNKHLLYANSNAPSSLHLTASTYFASQKW